MPFAMASVNCGPCSLWEIIIVERKMAGKTEKIPLKMVPRFENETAIAMTVPAMRLLPSNLSGV